MIRRGEIYWVDFRGAAGAEIRKTRPAVVVSEQDHNDNMATVTVVPFSSGRALPYELAVPAGVLGDGRPSRLKTHQLRAVDKGRLGRRFGVLPEPLMPALEESLRKHLGMRLSGSGSD